jgi:hypothetical protein
VCQLRNPVGREAEDQARDECRVFTLTEFANQEIRAD